MKDLGIVSRIFGMEIDWERNKRKLFVTQSSHVIKILEKFGMAFAKLVSTPLTKHFKISMRDSLDIDEEKELMKKIPYANTIGYLMYLMVCRRPNLRHSATLVSRHISNPGKLHWKAIKWVLKYLKGTSEEGAMFDGLQQSIKVEGFVDSNYVRDLDRRKSIIGYFFKFGVGLVSWKATLQHIMALSTTEAEYITTT